MRNKQLCVLAVDCSTDALNLIKHSLEATTKWRVLLSSSPQEALIRAQQESPDMILINFQMSQMNNIEIAMKLKSHPKTDDIPLLLITSLPHVISSQIFQDFGITSVIKKPFNWFSLADSIVLSFKCDREESCLY